MAKVTRLALQNAASAAGLLLTVEVVIADGYSRSGNARYCQTFSV